MSSFYYANALVLTPVAVLANQAGAQVIVGRITNLVEANWQHVAASGAVPGPYDELHPDYVHGAYCRGCLAADSDNVNQNPESFRHLHLVGPFRNGTPAPPVFHTSPLATARAWAQQHAATCHASPSSQGPTPRTG